MTNELRPAVPSRPHSMASVQIFLARDRTTLASESAFVYERHGTLHLVTNWHNVSGRNSITHEPLSKPWT